MKLFKTLLGELLISVMVVAAVLLFMAIFWQTMAPAFYAFLLATTSGAIGCLYFRGPN
jgi:hypothetical protein